MKTPHLFQIGLLQVISLLVLQTIQAGSATWNLNPLNGDWNTAQNWTPATVPNDDGDTATFAVSNTTGVSFSVPTTIIKEMDFSPGASAFIFNISGQRVLTFGSTGDGVVNNSGVVQNFVAGADLVSNTGSLIQFTGSSSAGSQTHFTAEGFPGYTQGSGFKFLDTSSAGEAVFLCRASTGPVAPGGGMDFYTSSTAGDAEITLEGGIVNGGSGCSICFFDTASAGSATITLNGGSASGAGGGRIYFYDDATAGHATFVAHGGMVSGAEGAFMVFFSGLTKSDDATFTINGGAVSGAEGAQLLVDGRADLGHSKIIINGGGGGGGGGECQFADNANGGWARVEILGNAFLSNYSTKRGGMTVGSIEGDGMIYIYQSLVSGSNNLDTTFSGIIQYSGALTKIGTGTLTLTGANTYAGGTTLSQGRLIIANKGGSGTGPGAVQVDGGTLGGSGTIAGAVTVGDGSGADATLAPAAEIKKQASLTIKSALTFNSDSTYSYTFKAKANKARADKVTAKGVTINSGASFNLSGTVQGTLGNGTVFTLLRNTAPTPITGTFANLPDGAILRVNGNNFQASYEGGDGNDLTLTVVP